MGPKTELAQALHAAKYRGMYETYRESHNRVAGPLTEGSEEFHYVRDMTLEQRFNFAGRVQAGVGSTKVVTPFNCAAAPTIRDSFTDGDNSIMSVAIKAAETMRRGCGVGYDFSTLRPRGATIKRLGSTSSGPVSFMEIFDAICRCVASSGHRRGAQMGVLRVDHPSIEEFVNAKRKSGALEGFNISVGITDEFMACVRDGLPFTLRFQGESYGEIDARVLWDKIMRSNYDWAEPGVLFLDRINEMNNLHWLEDIATTNPCAEVPLPPNGMCLLGSFNLVKYVCADGSFDYSLFRQDIPYAVRAMDRVIDVAYFPLPEQEDEAKAKRRIGLGVMGVANALEFMGYPYGTEEFCDVLDTILHILKVEAYRASIQLAKERGPFPAFNRNRYAESVFVRTLPEDVQSDIYKYGIRNSHLLSIAPTGTISLCADNVSSGIEPVLGYKTKRLIRMPDGERMFECDDYGYRELGVKGVLIQDVTVEQHLRVLATASQHVDQSISKTCNFPKDVPYDEFKNVYFRAWVLGAKGLTTYRYGCKRESIIEVVDEDEDARSAAACRIDPETGTRDCGD